MVTIMIFICAFRFKREVIGKMRWQLLQLVYEYVRLESQLPLKMIWFGFSDFKSNTKLQNLGALASSAF